MTDYYENEMVLQEGHDLQEPFLGQAYQAKHSTKIPQMQQFKKAKN